MPRIPSNRTGYVEYTCVGIPGYVIPPYDCGTSGYKKIPTRCKNGLSNHAWEDLSAVTNAPERSVLADTCHINYNPFTGLFIDLYGIFNDYLPSAIEDSCYETSDIYPTGFVNPHSKLKTSVEKAKGQVGICGQEEPAPPRVCMFEWSIQCSPKGEFWLPPVLTNTSCLPKDFCNQQASDWHPKAPDSCTYIMTECRSTCEIAASCFPQNPDPPEEIPDCCQYGACCQTGTCKEKVTKDDCLAGYWYHNLTCTPDPCVGGVCCVGGLCSFISYPDCEALSGDWTVGGSCIPINPCLHHECTSPCAGVSTSTSYPSMAECLAAGEVYDCAGTCTGAVKDPCSSPSYQCVDNLGVFELNCCCEDKPMGACCEPSGACSQTIEDDCLAPNVWTEGALCEPNECVCLCCAAEPAHNYCDGAGWILEPESRTTASGAHCSYEGWGTPVETPTACYNTWQGSFDTVIGDRPTCYIACAEDAIIWPDSYEGEDCPCDEYFLMEVYEWMGVECDFMIPYSEYEICMSQAEIDGHGGLLVCYLDHDIFYRMLISVISGPWHDATCTW